MSLTTRITLLVSALLVACGLLAGLGMRHALRRSAEAELSGRLDARLAWLEGAIEVELDDGEVQLEQREEPPNAAEHWRVSTADGRTLWLNGAPAPAGATERSRSLRFGPTDGPPLAGALLQADRGAEDIRGRPIWAKVPQDQVPDAAMRAARAAVPQWQFAEAWQRTRVKKRGAAGAVFELHGTTTQGRHEVRVDAAGTILRLKGEQASRFIDYQMPAEAVRLDLVLHSWTPAQAVEAELARALRVLWTVGALAVVSIGIGLAVVIRWQLSPLARMAQQAASIGPADPAGRIGHAGGSAELRKLRAAINSMVERLAEALGRERRFASTAAHELRTPLAQMRMSIDVALRQPRDAAAYREALMEASLDVDRLQRLVVGLLHLARGDEPVPGRPLPLSSLLRGVLAGADSTLALPATAEDLWILGDAELLRSALRNVLENARRYAPSEPPAIRIESTAHTVQVIVADRGPGVPESQRQRIFEPLTRLDSASRQAPEGFGLGLPLARSSTRALGGDLHCRARADGAAGAEFVFTLRRAAPADDSDN